MKYLITYHYTLKVDSWLISYYDIFITWHNCMILKLENMRYYFLT